MVGGFHYSPTLFIYLGLRYAAQVALALLILISFIYFLEVIELSRRITQKGDDYSFFYVMVISLCDTVRFHWLFLFLEQIA